MTGRSFWPRWRKAGHTSVDAGIAEDKPESTLAAEAPWLDRIREQEASGDVGGALGLIAEAIQRGATDPAVHAVHGQLLGRSARSIESVRAFRRAFTAGYRAPHFRAQFAAALAEVGEVREARLIADDLVRDAPENYDALVASAEYARLAGDWTGACERFRLASAARPDDASALAGYALALSEAGEPERALDLARAFDRESPGHAEVVGAIANACKVLGRPDTCLEALDRMAALATARSGFVSSRIKVNRAFMLVDLGRADEAARGLIELLESEPDVEAHTCLAFLLISLGCFREGFARYPMRWFTESLVGHRSHPERRRWGGDDPAGRAIVVGAEQGIGDLIMFARFLPELRARGARTMLVVPPAMRALADGLVGVDRVVASGEPVHGAAEFNQFVSLGDLAGRLGVDIDTLPVTIPYLGVERTRRTRWEQRLEGGPGPRVGLVWAGNPAHVRDGERSIRLEALAPIVAQPGLRFYSFQKGPQAAELASLPWRDRIVDLGPELVDFADTCAALLQMDLLITVDTSVAHAAGALGVPTWLLIALPADYRWLVEGDTTCWYPTMRLVRQSKHRAWASVIERVADDLAGLAGRSRAQARELALPRQRASRQPPRLSLDGVPDVVETRFGILQVPAAIDTESRSLRAYGEYLPAFARVVLELTSPGDSVVQVNPGAGELAIALSHRLGPSGHLIAFEPDRSKAAFLRQNAAGNSLRNVTIQVKRLDTGGPNATMDAQHLERIAGCVVTGDVDHAQLLDGASRMFESHRPWVAVAVPSRETMFAAVDALRRYGYRFWQWPVPLFRPENYLSRRRDVFDGETHVALLAVPEEREYVPSHPELRAVRPPVVASGGS